MSDIRKEINSEANNMLNFIKLGKRFGVYYVKNVISWVFIPLDDVTVTG